MSARNRRSPTPDLSEAALVPAIVCAWLQYREEGEIDWMRRWVRITDDTFDMHLSKGDPDPLNSFPLEKLFVGTLGGRAFSLLCEGGDAVDSDEEEITLEFRCCDDIEYDEFIAALLSRARHDGDEPDWESMYQELLEKYKLTESDLKHGKVTIDDLRRELLRAETALGDFKVENMRLKHAAQELETKLRALEEASRRKESQLDARERRIEDLEANLKLLMVETPTNDVAVQCNLGKELEQQTLAEWKKRHKLIMPTTAAECQTEQSSFRLSGPSKVSQSTLTGTVISISDAAQFAKKPAFTCGTQTIVAGCEFFPSATVVDLATFTDISARVDVALEAADAEAGGAAGSGSTTPRPSVPTSGGGARSRSGSVASRSATPTRHNSGAALKAATHHAGSTNPHPFLKSLSLAAVAPSQEQLTQGANKAASILANAGGSLLSRIPEHYRKALHSYKHRVGLLEKKLEEAAAAAKNTPVDLERLFDGLGWLQASTSFVSSNLPEKSTPNSRRSMDSNGGTGSGGPAVSNLDPAARWRAVHEEVQYELVSGKIGDLFRDLVRSGKKDMSPQLAAASEQFQAQYNALLDKAQEALNKTASVTDWERRVRAAIQRYEGYQVELGDSFGPALDVVTKHYHQLAEPVRKETNELLMEEPYQNHPLGNELCTAVASIHTSFLLRTQLETRDFLRHHQAAESIARFALSLKRASQIIASVRGCEAFAMEFGSSWPIVGVLTELPRRIVTEDVIMGNLKEWIGAAACKGRIRSYQVASAIQAAAAASNLNHNHPSQYHHGTPPPESMSSATGAGSGGSNNNTATVTSTMNPSAPLSALAATASPFAGFNPASGTSTPSSGSATPLSLEGRAPALSFKRSGSTSSNLLRRRSSSAARN